MVGITRSKVFFCEGKGQRKVIPHKVSSIWVKSSLVMGTEAGTNHIVSYKNDSSISNSSEMMIGTDIITNFFEATSEFWTGLKQPSQPHFRHLKGGKWQGL